MKINRRLLYSSVTDADADSKPNPVPWKLPQLSGSVFLLDPLADVKILDDWANQESPHSLDTMPH